MPFSENKASAIVTKKITDGERPPRPPKGKKLGLSDELWEVVQSSLAHEVEERPLVSTFVDFLEDATPDIAVLEELVEQDVVYQCSLYMYNVANTITHRAGLSLTLSS